MNLVAAVTLHAGGPGSGCRGPSCGRKASGNVLYHLTDKKNLSSIKEKGLLTQTTGAPKTNTEFAKWHDANAVYAIDNPKDAKQILENKLSFGEMEDGREGHQVLIAFRPVGPINKDPELDEDENKEFGWKGLSVKHNGAVPPGNIVGFHRVSRTGRVSPKLEKLK